MQGTVTVCQGMSGMSPPLPPSQAWADHTWEAPLSSVIHWAESMTIQGPGCKTCYWFCSSTHTSVCTLHTHARAHTHTQSHTQPHLDCVVACLHICHQRVGCKELLLPCPEPLNGRLQEWERGGRRGAHAQHGGRSSGCLQPQ